MTAIIQILAISLIFWVYQTRAQDNTLLSNFSTYSSKETRGKPDPDYGRETDEQRLLYHILRNYEKAVRPVRNASTPVVVKLGMTMTNIFDMDERNQVLTINVCADDYTAGFMRSRAMVVHTGEVFWPPPTQLRSTCKIDVTYFPFDSQHCSLKFGSWTYHGLQVDITNRSANIDLTNYVTSGEFDLVAVYQKRRVVLYTCCPEPYPDITFYIHIRRKTLYYMYNIVFPCLMMSILTLLVFWLPPDSGEKIALGITVLLAFSVFVLAIAEKMPETSDSMPLIGVYLTVVMGMTSVSVVMTVLVLNFHHRGPFHDPVESDNTNETNYVLHRYLSTEIPNGKPSVGKQSNGDVLKEENPVRCNGSFSRPASRCSEDINEKLLKALQVLIKRQQLEDDGQVLANEWRQIAQVIDRLLFWIFLVATTGITTTLLIIIPSINYASETADFDEKLYGLH
ncbi:unnamed protein product, partial [Mesorhabditis spiculigera]